MGIVKAFVLCWVVGMEHITLIEIMGREVIPAVAELGAAMVSLVSNLSSLNAPSMLVTQF